MGRNAASSQGKGVGRARETGRATTARRGDRRAGHAVAQRLPMPLRPPTHPDFPGGTGSRRSAPIPPWTPFWQSDDLAFRGCRLTFFHYFPCRLYFRKYFRMFLEWRPRRCLAVVGGRYAVAGGVPAAARLPGWGSQGGGQGPGLSGARPGPGGTFCLGVGAARAGRQGPSVRGERGCGSGAAQGGRPGPGVSHCVGGACDCEGFIIDEMLEHGCFASLREAFPEGGVACLVLPENVIFRNSLLFQNIN